MPVPSVRLGAVDRFFRSRTQLAAIAVLGLCVLLAVGVQIYSSLSLSRVLSENWRGAYDLLVTASEGGLTTCTSGSDRLIAPNFVGFSGAGGISLDQWSTIREIAGVEVAAPIGAVGQIANVAQDIYVDVPIDSQQKPTGYSLSGRLVIDDGVNRWELPPAEFLIQTSPEKSPGHRVISTAAGWSESQNYADVSLAVTPPFPVSVIAIDPASEKELLGDRGGFLDSLITIGSVDISTAESASVGFTDLIGKGRLKETPGMFTYLILAPQDSPVIPLIVNSATERSSSLTLESSTFSPLSDATSQNLAQLFAQVTPTLSPTQESTIDLSTRLIPFSGDPLSFPAPGTNVESRDFGGSYYTGDGLQPAIPGPAQLTPGTAANQSGCVMNAAPQDDFMSSATAPRGLGDYHEQTYRSLTTLPEPEVPVAPVPVGSYSVSDVDLGAGDVSYVPLGAYESGETQILGQVDDPDTARSQGVVRPGISGLGITTGSAGALTTLEAAKLIRGDTPIDAIRVRVAGVDRYDDAGRAKVAKVAEAIRALGLHVDVVAGSSREAVGIYVPDYTPTDAGGWEDLGWVRQQWSALDAAAKVESSLDVGGLALLVYAVVGGALLAGAASVLAGIARRRAVRTLRQIGWTGRQALVWVGGEYLVGAAVLVAVSATALGFAWWADTLSPILGTVVGVVVAGYCAGGLLSALLAMRDPQAPRRRGVHKDVHPVATAAAFGVKTAARTRGVTVTTALTLALIGAGVGVASGAILGAITGAGATLLAGVAVSSLLPLHLALAMVGVCSGLVLAVVGRRADRPRRARALDALTRMGWERRTVNVSLAAELAITLVLALILAPVAVAAVSLLANYPLIVTVPLTVAGTVLAAGVILTTRTARA